MTIAPEVSEDHAFVSLTVGPQVPDDTVFAELSPADAAFLRDHASRRLTSLVPGGPVASQWKRILEALEAALPPKGAGR